jgi:hypothetical protein
MGFGAKFFEILGGARTVRVSLAELPGPPSVEVTTLEVLTLSPLVVAVTSTTTVQVPLAEIVPLEKIRLVAATTGDQVGDPQSVVLAFGVEATCNPPGKVSEYPTPVREPPALGLVIVKVNVLTPPTAIGSGEKDLDIVGGASAVTATVALSLSVPVVPSLSVTTAVTVSVSLSPALPDTVAVNEQLYVPPAAIEPPVAQLPCPFRSPWMSSVRLVSVTASPLVFCTSTLKVTVPPGWVTLVGLVVLVTTTVGATSV